MTLAPLARLRYTDDMSTAPLTDYADQVLPDATVEHDAEGVTMRMPAWVTRPSESFQVNQAYHRMMASLSKLVAQEIIQAVRQLWATIGVVPVEIDRLEVGDLENRDNNVYVRLIVNGGVVAHDDDRRDEPEQQLHEVLRDLPDSGSMLYRVRADSGLVGPTLTPALLDTIERELLQDGPQQRRARQRETALAAQPRAPAARRRHRS